MIIKLSGINPNNLRDMLSNCQVSKSFHSEAMDALPRLIYKKNKISENLKYLYQKADFDKFFLTNKRDTRPAKNNLCHKSCHHDKAT